MKKSTKLLSVLLAVVMILSSLTVGAFAAKTKYQTVSDLDNLKAYSPYGTVTRLDTEERMSIVFDALDGLLAPMSQLNMGQVFSAAGLSLTINATSVNGICKTVDNVKNLLNNTLAGIAMAIVDLGVVEDVSLNSWQTGMSREGTAQLTIVKELLEVLQENKNVINTVLTSGLKLGMIGDLITGLDLKPINKMITDLPGTIKGLLYPMLSRPDDTSAQRANYTNTAGNDNGSAATIMDTYVKGLLTKRMNWTSYRVDASGNDLGYTVALPTTNATSRYFTINGDTITQFDFSYDSKNHPGEWVETVTYTKTEEAGNPGVYVFKAPDGYTGDQTLKYYAAGSKGYFLPSVAEAINNGSLDFSLVSGDSVLDLLYKFAPYVFREMAPVVLNGSVKKLLAGVFGVTFEKIGNKGELTDVPNDEFFTKDQGEYLWEWSDYKVIDGVPYYRFQDEFFKGTLPADLSVYYNMINWDYEVTGDFMDEFIPATNGATSAAGYTRVLPALNKFLGKAIDLVIKDNFTIKGTDYSREELINWNNGDNDQLLNNLLVSARKVFMLAPEQILDEYYADAQYYDAMMNGTLEQAVRGAICEGVKLLMPQLTFPDNIVNQPTIAIGAVVVRELLSQLMPSYNFDALIYADYNNRAIIEGKDNDYWVNTILTMGLDVGIYYLRNIADLGEDTAKGYSKVMLAQGALATDNLETQTYTADYDVSQWIKKVDWIVDWALCDEEWGWKMNKIATNVSYNITTAEDPWAKLNTIITSILPFDQLINVSNINTTATTFNGSTFLEKVLRGAVNALISLDVPALVSMFDVPSGYFTTKGIADQAIKLVVKVLNGVVNKVNGGELIPSATFTSVSAFLNHNNLKSVAVNLVGNLPTIYNNGLLHVVLPFVNMFLGWKTDPQEFKDPSIYFDTGSADTFLLNTASNSLKFQNTASGMLLRHRDTVNGGWTTSDQAYNIVVKSVDFGNSGITTTAKFPQTAAPQGTVPIPLTVPAKNDVATITITYAFTGKDGQALGGDQKMTTYAYMSTVDDQTSVSTAAVDAGDYWQRDAYNNFRFVTDIYAAVTETTVSASYKAATVQWGNKEKAFGGLSTSGMTTPASTYFRGLSATSTSSADFKASGFVPKLIKGDVTSTQGHLWAAKSGVTAETEFPYGVYDMGKATLKYGSKNGTYEIDFIYYTDNGVTKAAQEYVAKNISLDSIDTTKAGAEDAYNTYISALKTAVKWANYPKRTDYTTVVMPYTEAAVTALQDAYKALVDGGFFKKAADNQSTLQAVLDTVEDRDRDYDFQDYGLFEYFKYEAQRKQIREMINAYNGPEAPTDRIENEDVSYKQIQAILAAQTNANIKTGINGTIVAPAQEDVDAYQKALAEFTTPNYSDLQVADMEAKLPYYMNFMKVNPRNAYYNQFLAKEVSYADANFTSAVASKYTAESWAAFQKALTDAKAVLANSSALHSEIFDAKYALMVAENKLLETSKSMKDSGYLDNELTSLIANAETILNHAEYYNVVDGMTRDEAFTQLVKALGVRYTNLDGDDAILYNHSAYTFVDYDRVSSAKNKVAVDGAAAKLNDAIKNFVCNVVVEKNNDGVVNKVEQSVKYIQGIEPGTINSLDQLLTHVKASNSAATLAPVASKAGLFGTGAKVDLTLPEIGTLATYIVVIYGDVNGDGAIDLFDAYDVDRNLNGIERLTGIYATAADTDANDAVTLTDYDAIVKASAEIATINQNV